jgi:hypothetical protein
MEETHIISNFPDKDLESSDFENQKYDKDYLNEDYEESENVIKKAVELKPYFSNNTLPSSLYLEHNVLPLIYEALAEVEKIRPRDPIEFLCSYILEKNKKII